MKELYQKIKILLEEYQKKEGVKIVALQFTYSNRLVGNIQKMDVELEIE